MVLDYVEWEDASHAQRDGIRALKVTDDHEEFAGSFDASLGIRGQDLGGHTKALLFFDSTRPVGIVLVKRPPSSPEWAKGSIATVHGLKVASGLQGRGHGKEILLSAIAYVTQVWPDIVILALSVDADNEAAIALYRSVGMQDSGPIYRGRLGMEHRFELRLKQM